jgi:26S proteasome regulatory subunit N1
VSLLRRAPSLGKTSSAISIQSPHLNTRLGLAYAGSHREDLVALLLPNVSDDSVSMEVASLSALSLGFIGVGSCNYDVTSSILQTLMEREDSQLNEKWARFMALGLALLFLGEWWILLYPNNILTIAFAGRQDASDATIETLKAIPHPLSKQAQILVDICSFAGTSNVLKVQSMLHYCNDHIDKEKEDDTFQAFAVLGIALVAMGEDVGAEMSLRQFNHLVRIGL